MTRDEILSATPARLRLLVAEHVMNHAAPFARRPVPCPDGRPGCAVLHVDTFDAAGVRLPCYSAEIGAAWLVVERTKLLYDPPHVPLWHALTRDGVSGDWQVLRIETADDYYQTTTFEVFASGATAPEAICRAALLLALDGKLPRDEGD